MCQVWRLTSATVGAGDSGHQWTEGATSPGEPVNRSAQECLIPSCSSHFPQYGGGGGYRRTGVSANRTMVGRGHCILGTDQWGYALLTQTRL